MCIRDSSYLSPERLAALLGWAAEVRSGRLVLSGGGHQLVLSPGRVCQLDGQARRLSSPALRLEDTLYLSLDDLCALLSLELVPGDRGTELVLRA